MPWPGAESFLPHSFCLLQKPALILLHVVSDGLIALAYLSIPVALALFVKRRKDLVFSRVFVLFAAFILACAATHLMDIWTLWHPDYFAQGLIKAVTGLVSLATAVVLWPVLEQALKLPSPSQLAELNAELNQSMDELKGEIESRKRLEAQLRESEQQLKSVLDAAADGIVTTDDRGRIVLSNPAATRMFGYTAEQLAERSLAELTGVIPPHGQPADGAGPWAENGRSESECVGLRRDGSSFPLEMTLGGNTHVLRDISARKEQEQAIRKLNATLEEKIEERTRQLAQASAAKSQFLANMSHELRTPLNAILGFGQVLRKSLHDPEEQSVLRQMQSAGDALVRIIDDILDLTRIEADQVRLEQSPFTVADCLGQVENLMQGAAKDKGLRLRFGPVEQLPRPVLGDALRLQQILTNLVGNAIKFSEQGEVAVRLLRVGDTSQGPRLRFEVRDTGIGIDPVTVTRLFRPFTQADESSTRRYGGTGLGLVISRRLVELMGGTMGVESRVGEGSTFWLEIPFLWARDGAAPPAAGSDAPPAEEGPRLTGLRVLVVDDSALNRLLVERALRQEGALPTLAGDGQQALQILKARPDAVDVALMDIQMPVMDGLEATRAIRADAVLARLPVIAFTAGVMAEDRKAAEAAGVDGFLAKPVDIHWLVSTLAPYVPTTPAEVTGEDAAPAVTPDDGTGIPPLPGVDTERAALVTGGDRGFFLQMLGLFVAEFRDMGQWLRAELDGGRRESAKRRLHNLKGNAGNLGAMALMRTAAALETAVMDPDALLDRPIEDLSRQLADFVTAAEPWLKPPDQESASEAAPLDPVELRAWREALTRSDLAAVKRYAGLRPGLLARHGAAALASLDQAMQSLRFDDALAWLKRNLDPD